ncbi:hypothetical protein Tco_0889256 [Tanacetum coccineum]
MPGLSSLLEPSLSALFFVPWRESSTFTRTEYRCASTELITPDLTCPSTYQLLRNSGGDSGPDLSFEKSAFLERLFSLARVSLAEASKPDLSFGWSALAQSFGSTTHPSMFVGDDDESDDDDDACVEIPLVTPLRSAAMIPSSGNEGRSSAAPTAEGSNPQGKGVMVDDVVASSAGASRSRPSSGPAPSFRNVSGDAIHTNFFPFSVGLYYATYPMDGVARNCEFTREEWDAPYRPTFRVLPKEVFKDPSV